MRRLIRILVSGPLRGASFLLLPGLSLKRWLALGVLSVGVIALGLAFTFRFPVGPSFTTFVGTVSLRDAPSMLRGAVFVVLGVGALGFALFKLASSMRRARRKGRGLGLLDSLYLERVLGAGPRIVAIGGGTGLSTLLRGLKHYTSNLTAVVTVADDGGSSGRLRSELGILPPGDIRNCLVALADSEDVMQRLMDYRFSTTGDLNGHSFGNMLIAVLADIGGAFDKGVEMAGELLAVRGRVIPSTTANVTLVGNTVSGQTLVGESRVGTAHERLRSVTLIPTDAPAHPEAKEAIEKADLIILGPGSLFTSIVPNLLVSDIAASIASSAALKMYVCNVAEQPGETDGYSLPDHVNVVRSYLGEQAVDIVIVNDNLATDAMSHGVKLVKPEIGGKDGPIFVQADVIEETTFSHHDPAKLATVIAATYRTNRGIRRRFPREWLRPRPASLLRNGKAKIQPE